MMQTENRDILIDKITALKAEGLSRKDIANRLNGDSLKTPAGKDWTDALVGAFMTRHEITKSAKTTEKREVTVMETPKKARKTKTTGKRKAKTSSRRTRASKAVSNTGSDVVVGGSNVVSTDDRFALFATIVRSDLMSSDQKIRTLNTLI